MGNRGWPIGKRSCPIGNRNPRGSRQVFKRALKRFERQRRLGMRGANPETEAAVALRHIARNEPIGA